MNTWKPRIFLFQCQWCLYTEEDQQWVDHQLPDNFQLIKVPCTGRINPLYVLNAIQGGADGILISGCLPEKCHFKEGNLSARRQLDEFSQLLIYVGFAPERIHFAWLDLQDRGRIQKELVRMEDRLMSIGPSMNLASRSRVEERE